MTPRQTAASAFTPQDKINLVSATVAVFLGLITILGCVLKFWNDTDRRLSLLEYRMDKAEITPLTGVTAPRETHSFARKSN